MNILPGTALKIDDLGDELQFTLSREHGWLEYVLWPGVLTALLILTFYYRSAGLFIALGAAIVILLRSWIQGPYTELRISSRGIVATGNLQRWSADDVSIPAVKVNSIGYSSGGENEHSGLYVWHGDSGRKRTCVLPGISRKKAQTVTDAITAKFPQFKIGTGSIFSISIGVGT